MDRRVAVGHWALRGFWKGIVCHVLMLRVEYGEITTGRSVGLHDGAVEMYCSFEYGEHHRITGQVT
jgi:hypothetical protein